MSQIRQMCKELDSTEEFEQSLESRKEDETDSTNTVVVARTFLHSLGDLQNCLYSSQ